VDNLGKMWTTPAGNEKLYDFKGKIPEKTSDSSPQQFSTGGENFQCERCLQPKSQHDLVLFFTDGTVLVGIYSLKFSTSC